VYVNYVINGTITNRISRFTLNTGNANDLVETSQLILLEQTGIQTNHKAGDLAFGPDGYLYIGFGDGGGSFDPGNNGQNLNSLLAKIIRINIDSKSPPLNYSIPPDNPFVGVAGLDEIWFFGMRNPWRISFDRTTGDMWIADVGQNEYEEIDFIPAGTPGGLYFGWDCWEGHNNLDSASCNYPTLTWPIFEYQHNCPCPNGQGASISGGFVYRGTSYPALKGYYISADYVSNQYWLTKKIPGSNPPAFNTYNFNGNGQIDDLVSFGEDDNGELYACNLQGPLYRISATGPLPVKWVSIDAWHIPNGNRVEWVIHETSGIDHFELQRTLAPDFNKTTAVALVSPVQDSMHYGSDDAYLQSNVVYYRVVAYMSNGTKEYSPIARLIAEDVNRPTLIFDFNLNLWKLSLPDDWQSGKVVIYDVQGKEVFAKNLSQDKMIDLPPPIVPGVYFIEIDSDSGKWSDKLIW